MLLYDDMKRNSDDLEIPLKDKMKEGFFETLLMSANVWIAFMDPDERVMIWNKAAEEISGYSETEVSGSGEIWKKLYPEKEYRVKITEKIRSIIANKKELENFETVIITKEGEKKHISWNTREMVDENGKVTGYIAMGRDITEIVAIGNQFRTLLMNANVLVSFVDTEDTVLIWNKAAEDITGYTKDEVMGRSEIWFKLYPDPEHADEAVKKILAIVKERKKEGTRYEGAIRTKSGSHKIISWNTKEITDEQNEIRGHIIVGIDVTNEKKIQSDIFGFIAESAMRLKNPVEVIRDHLYDLAKRVEDRDITSDDVLLQLKIQMKNADQIIENLRGLNEAIAKSFEEMPSEMKKFLSE